MPSKWLAIKGSSIIVPKQVAGLGENHLECCCFSPTSVRNSPHFIADIVH